jgi:hypothetical protein
MPYHAVKANISDKQLHTLARGGAISISGGHIGQGPHTLFLTSQQASRLSKGKGMRLHLSGSQLSHHLKHGGGLWSSFKGLASKAFNGAKSAVGAIAPVVAPLIKQYAPGVIDKAAAFATPLAGNLLNRGLGKAGVSQGIQNLIRNGLDTAVAAGSNALKDKIQGSGMKRGRGIARTRRAKAADRPIRGGMLPKPIRAIGGGLFMPGGSILPKPIRAANTTAAGM